MRARQLPVPAVDGLEPVPEGRGDEVAGSLKDAVVAALKPLKFRYQSKLSGHGTGFLSRRTKTHHDVMVEFDWGPRSREVYAKLYVRGAGFSEFRDLPIGGRDGRCPKVQSPEAVAAVARNIALSVSVMEAEWVPKVEALMGPGPAWFKANRAPQLGGLGDIW